MLRSRAVNFLSVFALAGALAGTQISGCPRSENTTPGFGRSGDDAASGAARPAKRAPAEAPSNGDKPEVEPRNP